MKEIKINHLRLENFKCHRLLELELRGRNASVYGDNAAGKTSIYDGLSWLLFGKDSKGAGEKNLELKPLGADGQVLDHKAITAVEAELEVDGRSLTLRRTLREVWSTRRGSSKEVYDGNTSEYFVDGVPCKKCAYDAKIQEMVPEDIFRLLTCVSYFPQEMDWRIRRNVLFQAVSAGSDREIMATDRRFDPLAEAAGALDLEEYKAKLLAQRKSYMGLKTDIPARISENQEALERLRSVEYGALRAQREEAAAQKAALEADLARIRENGLLTQRRNEQQDIRLRLRELEQENREYRQSQQGADETGALGRELDQARLTVNALRFTCRKLTDEKQRLEREVEACRADWARYNGMVFRGGTCPTCGQSLPAAAQEQAMREHEARVSRGKAEAVDRSNLAKERLAEIGRELEERKAEATGKVSELEKRLEEAARNKPVAEDLPNYAIRRQELQEMADRLGQQIYGLETDAASQTASLRNRLRTLEATLEDLTCQLVRQNQIPEVEARIQALRDQAAEGAAKLEELDRMLWLMEEYIQYKTSFLEDSVNSLFRLARFRLFRQQANGGIAERCDVCYGGIPYSGLNSGARINVGIDIINTLSRAYGVKVPLFVDNAESVTRLEGAQTQVIRLVVSERDKEVRVRYED